MPPVSGPLPVTLLALLHRWIRSRFLVRPQLLTRRALLPMGSDSPSVPPDSHTRVLSPRRPVTAGASVTAASLARRARMKPSRMHTRGVCKDHERRRWRDGSIGRGAVAAALVWVLLAAGVVRAAEVDCPVGDAAGIPTNGLVASYLFDGNTHDAVGGHHGTPHNVTLTSNRFGRGSSAYSFNGTNAYIQIPDHNAFSLPTTKRLSISVWMRPGTLNFPEYEGTERYVHWLGKGVPGQHEWAFRMYNKDSPKPNRTSFYLFNLGGDRGTGSYVQELVMSGTWYHYVAVANMRTDTITWYKNGRQKDRDCFRYNTSTCNPDDGVTVEDPVNPQSGTAPVRIGTSDFDSFFKGAIDNLHIYSRALSVAEVGRLCRDTTP
jgi:Concanavalin A-like lectin/glucanases superfamily